MGLGAGQGEASVMSKAEATRSLSSDRPALVTRRARSQEVIMVVVPSVAQIYSEMSGPLRFS